MIIVPPPPLSASRRTVDGLRDAVRAGVAFHPHDHAVGGGWLGRRTDVSDTQAVLCFNPDAPGTTLTPTARILGFAPISQDTIVRPPDLQLHLVAGGLALLCAFGRLLWKATVNAGFLAEARQSGDALVMVVDRTEGVHPHPLAGVPPAQIWVGHIPVAGSAR